MPATTTLARAKRSAYLIHADRKLHHAQHYIGSTDDLARREREHRTGRGSPLLAAMIANGIDFRVVRVWEDADRTFERKLKNRKNARGLCPLCAMNGGEQRVHGEQQERIEDWRAGRLAA